MKILVLNSGSSSLKFQVFNTTKYKSILTGQADRIGIKDSTFSYNDTTIKKNLTNHEAAIKLIFSTLKELGIDKIDAVGHRVVHGGETYKKSCIITPTVIKKIKELSALAPLHNPANLKGIVACKKEYPKLKQVAVFDTSFHQTIPKESYMYAIPSKYYDKYKIRKYGFHGTSHKYVMEQATKLLKKSNAKIITCHLGNGSSVCAIKNKKSIETSMGFTPLQGLVMGTRAGDVDPEIISFLAKNEKKKTSEIVTILNKESGLKGLCGDSDMREIHNKYNKSKKHKLAYDVDLHRLISYIGSYHALLNGVDALVFTAGIGEKAWYLRKSICDRLTNLGYKLDQKKNKANNSVEISVKNAKTKIFVIPTNEELMIAKETHKLVK